jgi:hypothetical protein
MDNNRYLRYANAAGNFLLRLVPIAGEYADARTTRIPNSDATNRAGGIIEITANSVCRVSGIGGVAAGVLAHDPLFTGLGAAIYGVVTAGHEYRYIRRRGMARENEDATI